MIRVLRFFLPGFRTQAGWLMGLGIRFGGNSKPFIWGFTIFGIPYFGPNYKGIVVFPGSLFRKTPLTAMRVQHANPQNKVLARMIGVVT